MDKIQEEVNKFAKELSEKEFYQKVKEEFGFVPSEGNSYLVGLHEHSVCFAQVVKNPLALKGKTEKRKREH